MKKAILFLFMFLTFSLGTTLFAQQDFSKEVIVYFTTGAQRTAQTTQATITAAEINTVLQKHNVRSEDVAAAFPDFVESDMVKTTPEGRKISQPNLAKIFKIRISNANDRDALIQDLKKLPNVLFAEPNGMAAPLVIPNDQHFGRQWNLRNTGQYGGTPGADIKATEAWDIFTGSSQRKIGIVDWGVDASHLDLSGKVSGDTYTHWHGTHVAGIAAAKTNNSTGIAGVDWNAQIISRNIDGQDLAGISSKIQSAIDAGADVFNNSWYLTQGYSTTVRLAFAYAYKLNRAATVAMGNDYGPVVRYPAAYGQGIIAVGATTIIDTKTPYSNTGNHIDVSAPGGYWDQNERQIYSTMPGGGYDYASGTSMAAPHVAGISSLLKGYNSNLSNDDIENIIKLSADDKGPTGWDSEYGTGRVNARRALNFLRSPMQLTQTFAIGGSDQGASSLYQMTVYGAQALGLQDGNYWVKRHEVRTTVSYTANNWRAVWGRGTFTNGWANESSVNFTYGFCEPITGTVTSTNATLRTYVYEVFANSDGSGFLGWYPTPPNNVRFEYTILSIPNTITTNSTLDGNFVFDNSVTVNSGVTLTVTPGSVLSFASGKSLTVNGTLNAQGTSSAPITFTSASGTTPGSWGSIVLSGSGASGSTISYANIQYGTQIDVLNTSNVTVQNCSISNFSVHAINFNGSNGSALYNTITSNNIYHGIVIQNGTVTCTENVVKKIAPNSRRGVGIFYGGGTGGYVRRNDVRGWNWGICAIWGASPASLSSGYPKNNRITDCDNGLTVYRESYPIFGTYLNSPYSKNSIYDNTYNAVVGTSYPEFASDLYARGNWWGSAPPNTSKFRVGPNAYFCYDEYLSSDPWAGFPLPSVIAAGSEMEAPQVAASVRAAGDAAQSTALASNENAAFNESDPKDALLTGIELQAQNKHKEAKDFFLSYLNKHPDNPAAYVYLYNCYNEETRNEITRYFEKLPKKANPDIRLLLSYLYLKQGNVEAAKKTNNDIIEENKNTELAARAKLNNFYIVLYIENDPQTASALLDEVLNNPKLSTPMELDLAQSALKTYVDPKTGNMPYFNSERKEIESVSIENVQDGLLANYPNPFNPSTTISYQLKANSQILLKVYDVLGREISVLADGYKEAGYYSATFDGSRLSSGIYFLRMVVTDENQKHVYNKTTKLLLTK